MVKLSGCKMLPIPNIFRHLPKSYKMKNHGLIFKREDLQPRGRGLESWCRIIDRNKGSQMGHTKNSLINSFKTFFRATIARWCSSSARRPAPTIQWRATSTAWPTTTSWPPTHSTQQAEAANRWKTQRFDFQFLSETFLYMFTVESIKVLANVRFF